MAKERDPIEEHNRKLDLIFQEMQDREDRELFERLKKVGYNQNEKGVRNLIRACRDLGLKRGMSVTEARVSGDQLLKVGLDMEMFDEELNVKPKNEGDDEADEEAG